jgi:hypothetical protein
MVFACCKVLCQYSAGGKKSSAISTRALADILMKYLLEMKLKLLLVL